MPLQRDLGGYLRLKSNAQTRVPCRDECKNPTFKDGVWPCVFSLQATGIRTSLRLTRKIYLPDLKRGQTQISTKEMLSIQNLGKRSLAEKHSCTLSLKWEAHKLRFPRSFERGIERLPIWTQVIGFHAALPARGTLSTCS